MQPPRAPQYPPSFGHSLRPGPAAGRACPLCRLGGPRERQEGSVYLENTLLADDSGVGREWERLERLHGLYLPSRQNENVISSVGLGRVGNVLSPQDPCAVLPQPSAMNPGLVLLLPAKSPSAGPDTVLGVLALLPCPSPTLASHLRPPTFVLPTGRES